MDSLNIYISVSELGGGHADRGIELASRFIAHGHRVAFFTSHPAIRSRFGDCAVYECAAIRWYEGNRGISTMPSFANIALPLPEHDHYTGERRWKTSVIEEVVKRYYDIRQHARDDMAAHGKPDIVVSDGCLQMPRWAQIRKKIKDVSVFNASGPDFTALQLLLFKAGQELGEPYIEHSDVKIIPDLPPPFTTCELNIRNMNAEELDFVGPFYRTDMQPNDKGLIYFPITGTYGTKTMLERKYLPLLEGMERNVVASLADPRRESESSGAVTKYGWLTDIAVNELFATAHYLIFSGSHNVAMKAIMFGKPMIIMPTQPEQRGEARKLEALGIAIVVHSPKDFIYAIGEMETNYDYYETRAKRIMMLARKMNRKKSGADRAAEIIERYAYA